MSISRFLKKAKDIQEGHRRGDEKPHESGGHDESNWLVSYADMMTLLCAFFIMMFSISTLSKPEFEKIRKEVSEQMGGTYEQPNQRLHQAISALLEDKGLQKNVSISSDVYGTTLAFQSTVFFEPMSAVLRSESRKVIDSLVERILQDDLMEYRKFKILVEGHTDGQPITAGDFPSNWELSSARATEVLHVFVDKGFSPDQTMAIGLADTRPEQPNRLPSGEWASEEMLSQNRRVVIRLLNPEVGFFPWDNSR